MGLLDRVTEQCPYCLVEYYQPWALDRHINKCAKDHFGIKAEEEDESRKEDSSDESC